MASTAAIRVYVCALIEYTLMVRDIERKNLS